MAHRLIQYQALFTLRNVLVTWVVFYFLNLVGIPVKWHVHTLMRFSPRPVGGQPSMYFFKSWCRNSNTKYSFFSLCTTSNNLHKDIYIYIYTVTDTEQRYFLGVYLNRFFFKLLNRYLKWTCNAEHTNWSIIQMPLKYTVCNSKCTVITQVQILNKDILGVYLNRFFFKLLNHYLKWTYNAEYTNWSIIQMPLKYTVCNSKWTV